jgi:predicted permease
MDFGFVIYAVIIILAVFLVMLPVTVLFCKRKSSRGALLQASFRSNYALIGLPLAQSLFGTEGVIVATLLSAVTIPLYNVLAVISLSVFKNDGSKISVKGILLGIVKNPLILSVLSGLIALGIRGVFVNCGIDFRLTDIKPIYTVLGYLSGLATPLALLVLGAQFEFSAVAALKREIILGTMVRIFIVPLFGVGIAYLFLRNSFGGAHFAAFVALFATPVAVSSVPMAQEMDADAILAGQLVVWTTLFSTLSVFTASFLLRMAGIF